MAKIAVDNLIQNMTPEQRILVSQFYAKFDVIGGAAHRKILNVEPLYYRGVIAGQEFLTYANTKMYLCLELECSVLTADINNASLGWVHGLDENVAVHFTLSNDESYFNVSSFYMFGNVRQLNIDFAAIEVLKYTYMKFLGYRITLS
jgi:hypothetical protein